MSKVNSFAYGEISGKFGNTVGAVDKKGNTTMREYRAPSDPKTENQMRQRNRFSFVNTELSLMKLMFKQTYVACKTKEELRKAGWGAVNNAVSGDYPDFSVNYENLVIARGSLPKLEKITVTTTGDTKVNATWDTTPFLGIDPADQVKFVFTNPDSKIWHMAEEVSKRSEGAVDIQLPVVWTGIEVHCWAFTMRLDGKATSTSQYISALQL
ncbi:DUF6266 family protein [Microbacter margulisiae]|uniref:Uncharacterized protein n=1 Tax=Microbacter margulisiae TaxID=1350067 RepID=A0A7W5DR57_9PORP|nr:DUF6266 family protein [Microbacter margulisiae]MBB3187230.1 hypothetical protein [Microbacter margulisiae]